jgi:hypothetical protein
MIDIKNLTIKKAHDAILNKEYTAVDGNHAHRYSNCNKG